MTPPTGARRLLDALRHRRTLSMLDQIVSGMSNVVVTVMVARLLPPEGFGEFSVAMVAYGLALGVIRAVAGEPWLSAHSDDAPGDRHRASGDLLRAGFTSSVASAAVVLAFAATIGGPATGALVALALVLPFVGMQDSLRHVAVVDRPHLALASDLVWLAAVVPVVAMAPAGASPAWFVVAWGVAGTVGLGVALATLRVPAETGSATRWLRDHREMAGAFLAETTTARAAGHVVLLGLGVVAGLPALGAVRAAQVFYGPLNTLFAGMYLALVPDGARRRGEPGALLRMMVMASLVVTGAALAWTAAGLFMPDRWGAALFGTTWAEAEEVMVPVGLGTVFGSAATGAFAGLRSLGAARLSLRARLWSLPPQALCAMVGALAGAALGYAIGFAVGSAIVTVLWWVVFLSALRRPPERSGGAAPDAVPAGTPS